MIDDALYDFETGQTWYQPDSGYWVPFTTTIPARDQFPAQTVNMYFMKSNAPEMVKILTNIPEAYRKYSGVDISFQKRYSNGWQLGGSVTISKTWELTSLEITIISGGYSLPGNNASWFVNCDGRLFLTLIGHWLSKYTEPLICLLVLCRLSISIYTAELPGESVTVYVPEDRAVANGVDLNRSSSYSINTAIQEGSRRNYTYENCDFRLEKRFQFGKFGNFGVFSRYL